MVYIELIGYVARKSRASELIGEFNVTGIVDHTVRTLIHGLLLQAKPLNLDVLQLFIILMAFFPFVLLGMMRRPNLTMVASISLYFTARHLDWNLSSFPDGRWYLNPFCWQLLFVLGAWLSIGARQKNGISALQEFQILRVAAWLYLIFALVVTIAGRFPRIAGIVPDYLLEAFLPNERENLAPYRVLHFLALVFLFLTWCHGTGVDFDGKRCSRSPSVARNGYRSSAPACFFGLPLIWCPDRGPRIFLAIRVLVRLAGISIMTGIASHVSCVETARIASPHSRPRPMTGLPQEGRLVK